VRAPDEALEEQDDGGGKATRTVTLATVIATSVGVERRPSETMSVVAHAGGWTVPVAIIAQPVATSEATALAVRRTPSGERAGGVAGPAARTAIADGAALTATPPIR
jgi:hypothetical protein